MDYHQRYRIASVFLQLTVTVIVTEKNKAVNNRNKKILVKVHTLTADEIKCKC